MKIAKEHKNGKYSIVRCEGRLDATTAPQLEEVLIEALKDVHRIVLLDLGQVDYLSSAGMRLLLAVTKNAQKQHKVFAIFSVQEDVREIIQMAGFEKILTIHPDEATACKMLG